MRKYTKLFAGVLCAIALTIATSAFAADTVKASTGNVVQTTSVEQTSLFNAGELGLSLGTGYNVDRSAAFQQDYNLNLTAGAFYFPTRNIGLEASVPFYQTKGVSVDEVQAGVVLRLPLGKKVALLKNVAPYVGVGGAYNWESDQRWTYIAKAGAELRLNSKWGVFVEGQYRNNEFKDWNKGGTSVQGGLRLVL